MPMGSELRILLLGGALLTLVYFLRNISKNRLQIDYAIFWSIFAGCLFLMGLFPGVIVWVAGKLGFESPANMVYLIVIFVLMIKLFTNTIKLSKMNRQITDMAQHIAIKEADENREDGKEEEK